MQLSHAISLQLVSLNLKLHPLTKRAFSPQCKHISCSKVVAYYDLLPWMAAIMVSIEEVFGFCRLSRFNRSAGLIFESIRILEEERMYLGIIIIYNSGTLYQVDVFSSKLSIYLIAYMVGSDLFCGILWFMLEWREALYGIFIDFYGRKLGSRASWDKLVILDSKWESKMVLSCSGHISRLFINIIIKIYRSCGHCQS